MQTQFCRHCDDLVGTQHILSLSAGATRVEPEHCSRCKGYDPRAVRFAWWEKDKEKQLAEWAEQVEFEYRSVSGAFGAPRWQALPDSLRQLIIKLVADEIANGEEQVWYATGGDE